MRINMNKVTIENPYIIIDLILFLALFFSIVVGYFVFSALREKISKIQDKIQNLENALNRGVKTHASPESKTIKKTKAQTNSLSKNVVVSEKMKKKASSPQQPQTEYWTQKIQKTLEQDIATKLTVWIGSVSLICAAFFLVQYSIELGWLGPSVRVSLGGLFGVILIAVGQWIIKQKSIANAQRMAQGLVGAGIVALYASLYATTSLYDLLPPLVSFAGMAVVTTLAVILSLRHGQPIAVFALLGGLLTPLLLDSDEPNAIAIFIYLFLLFGGLFTVLVRKGWWEMAIASLVGVYCWSAFWYFTALSAPDALVLIVFAMAVAAVVLTVTGKKIAEESIEPDGKLPIHLLNFTAIAGSALTIISISFEMTLTLFDWSMFGLISLALIVLSYFQPTVYQRPLLAKLFSSLLLLSLWAPNVPLEDAVAVLTGMSGIYIIGGAFLMRKVRDPRFWASIQVITAISLYVISYFTFVLPASFTESFGLFWGTISLIFAGLAIHQIADIREKYKADALIREHLLMIYTLAASTFIALGIAIELPWHYVPSAIAGQIAVTTFLYRRFNIAFLKTIILILTLAFIGMNYEQLLLFYSIIMHSLAGMAPPANSIHSLILDAPLFKLGIPFGLFSVALWMMIKWDQDRRLVHTLFGTTLALLIVMAYYALRHIFHVGEMNIFSINSTFMERGILTIGCGVTGIFLLHLMNLRSLTFLDPWAKGLFHLSMFRLVYFDLLINNPYWSGPQFVGNTPLLNGVTLTYGFGTLLATWASYNKDMTPQSIIYKAVGFTSLFAFSTLSVRQYFHGGNLLESSIASAELYGYSFAWLLTGLLCLTIGIKQRNKTARIASLAFMVLTVLKVFLFDAAELEGLYRVFSFLGLGVSLIALSYFYTKFVFRSTEN